MRVDLVLGTAQLLRPYGVVQRRRHIPSLSDAQGLVDAAGSLGVMAVDTAPAYGQAEAAIGAAGTRLRVHTKLDPAVSPEESLAGSLMRLRRQDIDLLYVHEASEVLNRASGVLAEASSFVGRRVGRLGASIYEVKEFDAAIADPRISAVQAPVNLFDRRIGEDRLLEAGRRGIAVYARSVLLQGVLGASPDMLPAAVAHLRPYVEALHDLARQLGRPALELALGWVRALPGIRGIVLGAESAEDLIALVAAYHSARLTGSELAALRQLRAPAFPLCDPRQWTPRHP